MCAGAAIAAVIAPRPVDAAVSRSFAPSSSVIALVAPPVDPTLMPTVASETTEPAASELSDPVTGDIDPSTVASDVGLPRATSHPHSLLPATGSDPLDCMMAVAVLLLLTGVLALGVAHGRRRSIA